ncbi:unnamed protein product [Calicophoron daubneyi]|uniref:Schwannomin interacting protein 1 C-terminal domain-containing protein n=1 Tax=Calicophoron daubneyi TaxID=300641 RepID=A0AAV2TER0_CALDB
MHHCEIVFFGIFHQITPNFGNCSDNPYWEKFGLWGIPVHMYPWNIRNATSVDLKISVSPHSTISEKSPDKPESLHFCCVSDVYFPNIVKISVPIGIICYLGCTGFKVNQILPIPKTHTTVFSVETAKQLSDKWIAPSFSSEQTSFFQDSVKRNPYADCGNACTTEPIKTKAVDVLDSPKSPPNETERFLRPLRPSVSTMTCETDDESVSEDETDLWIGEPKTRFEAALRRARVAESRRKQASNAERNGQLKKRLPDWGSPIRCSESVASKGLQPCLPTNLDHSLDIPTQSADSVGDMADDKRTNEESTAYPCFKAATVSSRKQPSPSMFSAPEFWNSDEFWFTRSQLSSFSERSMSEVLQQAHLRSEMSSLIDEAGRYYEIMLEQKRKDCNDKSKEEILLGLLEKHRRSQFNTKIYMDQLTDIAHNQVEVERRRWGILSPAVAKLLKIGSRENTRLTPSMLKQLSASQLHLVIDDLNSGVEALNGSLMKELIERDDLHLEQGGKLIELEDLVAKFKELCIKTSIRQFRRQNSVEQRVSRPTSMIHHPLRSHEQTVQASRISAAPPIPTAQSKRVSEGAVSRFWSSSSSHKPLWKRFSADQSSVPHSDVPQ